MLIRAIEKHEEEFCGLRFGFVFRIKQKKNNNNQALSTESTLTNPMSSESTEHADLGF